MMSKYGTKMEIGIGKVKNKVMKVMGMEMGKMGEKEILKMKNNGRFGEVKKVNEKERKLIDFGKELKV